MTPTNTPETVERFTASGSFLDGKLGPIAISPPVFIRDGESPEAARSRTNAIMTQLAAALNAARALIDKIEDNPTLFFGMEDTCIDEFDDLRNALEALS